MVFSVAGSVAKLFGQTGHTRYGDGCGIVICVQKLEKFFMY